MFDVRLSVIALIFMAVMIGAGIGQPAPNPSLQQQPAPNPALRQQPAPNPALQQMCQMIREGKIMGGAYEGSIDPETAKASGCSQAESAKIRSLY